MRNSRRDFEVEQLEARLMMSVHQLTSYHDDFFHPNATFAVGSKLYFVLERFATGGELYVTDGTPAGTQLLKDIWPGSKPDSGFFAEDPGDFTALGEEVIFTANDGVTGRGLWRTDGTPEGTTLLRGAEGVDFHNLSLLNGHVYAFRDSQSSGHSDIWISDGTSAGTKIVDKVPGRVYESVFVNGDMLFAAEDDNFVDSLWVFHPATGKVALVRSGVRQAFGFSALGSKVIFSALPPKASEDANHSLWITDETASGTHELIPGKGVTPYLDSTGSLDTSPVATVVFANKLFFAAAPAGGSKEVWVSDGTPSGHTRGR